MLKRMMLGLAMATALALSGGQAMAAEPTVIDLNVGGQSIRFPVPTGLCPATGPYAKVADKVAKLDEVNDTVLTLYSCADMAAGTFELGNYLIVKTPKGTSGQTIPLSMLLDAYRQAPEMFGEAVDKAVDTKELGKDFSEAFDEKITVGGGIKVAGADEGGIYLVGSVQMQGGGRTVETSLATGVTAVKGKVLGVNLYGPGGKGEVAKRLRETKAAVAAMLAAN
jgi:hypothetical protein